MLADPWLARWMPLVLDKAGAAPVLEIGCGHGDDTATLAAAGLRVVAFDLSPASVALAKTRVPAAHIQCRDIRDPFPAKAGSLGVVVASLSLHYFPWEETVRIAGRVREVLRPGGVLLCRLNSTQDRHFGAGRGEAIEPDYFRVDGQCKRFFDEDAVRRLFAGGWSVRALEHVTTRKYVRRKAAWEAVLERT